MPLARPVFLILHWQPMVSDSHSIEELHRSLRITRSARYYMRMVVGIFCGAIAALFLAWFMHYLIQSSDLVLSKAERNHMLDFVRVKRSESIKRKDRAPERPKMNKSPEVPQMSQGQADSGQQLAVSAMPIETNVDIGQSVAGISGEGEYMPIVKVAPVYPSSALSRGLAGSCLVEYTVTNAGTVKDVVVIEDECTDRVFYKPSIDAALRFKYKPRVIDGAAVEVHGIGNIFRYEIVGK